MVEEKRLFMAQDMQLEERRKIAVESIKSLQLRIRKIAEADLAYREEKLKKTKKLLSDMDEKHRTLIKPLFDDVDNSGRKAVESMLRITWDAGEFFIRSMFGNDAVNFALETLKKENEGN
jgi:hypothetical protein